MLWTRRLLTFLNRHCRAATGDGWRAVTLSFLLIVFVLPCGAYDRIITSRAGERYSSATRSTCTWNNRRSRRTLKYLIGSSSASRYLTRAFFGRIVPTRVQVSMQVPRRSSQDGVRQDVGSESRTEEAERQRFIRRGQRFIMYFQTMSVKSLRSIRPWRTFYATASGSEETSAHSDSEKQNRDPDVIADSVSNRDAKPF
ncbi:uncharacterized protein LOC116842207 isoform X1 [Odontomachus brunneus]|uniref:uncharacterized protein LOC116842207 isoform X1 n=1 Tax=Odontomachus brunneus TaxID=486640 RepID=UPI0013F2954A|nr:uncharacterized protein LOC116842207 isoform X1 [Odontomachus brunneus]